MSIKRLTIAFCAAVGLWSVVATHAGADEPDAKTVLAAAAAKAAAAADTRFAFSIAFHNVAGGEETHALLRYDPRRAEGARWSLLEGAVEDLSEDERKKLEDLEKEERPDSRLVYDRLGEIVDELRLVEETDDLAVFRGPIRRDGAPDDALEATVTLDKAAGYIRRIDVRAVRAFKPAPIAKIRAMTQTQFYAAPTQGRPALLERSENAVEGKAMFQSFSSQTNQRFFDVTPVALGAAGDASTAD